MIVGEQTDLNFTLAKQLKSARSSEGYLSSDQKDLRGSTVEIPLVSEANLSTKQRNRHKMSLQRTFMPKEKSSENILTHIRERALFLLKVKAFTKFE